VFEHDTREPSRVRTLRPLPAPHLTKEREMDKWKVGQKVFVVIVLNQKEPNSGYETITKVGRKWVTCGEGWRERRFCRKTKLIDGGEYSSPGEIYNSEDDYRAENEAKFYQRNLKVKMGYSPNRGVGVRDILAAAKLLGIELEIFK